MSIYYYPKLDRFLDVHQIDDLYFYLRLSSDDDLSNVMIKKLKAPNIQDK